MITAEAARIFGQASWPLENEISTRHEVGAGDQYLHVGARVAVYVGVDDDV
jgi:hypothetical protein